MTKVDENYTPYTSTPYWGREYNLQIVKGEEVIADYNSTLMKANQGADPFDIKFHVISTAGLTPTFTVEILGLSQSTMNKLLMWNVGTSLEKGIKIKLYAGYTSVGSGPLPLIAQGIIIQAFPVSGPPEMWFRLVCITNGEFNTPILKPKYTYEPNTNTNEQNNEEEQQLNPDTPQESIKAKDAIQKELNVIRNKIEENGGEVELQIKPGVLEWVGEKLTSLIDAQGKTITKLANEIQDKYNVIVSGVSELVDNTKTIVKIVVYVSKHLDELKQQNPPQDVPVINATNGLLNVGTLEYGGFVCSVTRLLNTELNIGSVCRLESKLMPGYSGRFLTTSVHYIGHYRGREWFTRLSLLKMDANTSK